MDFLIYCSFKSSKQPFMSPGFIMPLQTLNDGLIGILNFSEIQPNEGRATNTGSLRCPLALGGLSQLCGGVEFVVERFYAHAQLFGGGGFVAVVAFKGFVNRLQFEVA